MKKLFFTGYGLLYAIPPGVAGLLLVAAGVDAGWRAVLLSAGVLICGLPILFLIDLIRLLRSR